MLNQIKYLFKHSFIYSISNLAIKASGIILLPVYSSFISIGDFGILSILEVTIAIFSEVLNLGIGPALVMMSSVEEFKNRKKEILFTLSFFSVFILVIFILIGEILIPHISILFQNPGEFYSYLRLSLYIISLRVINNLFLDKLRADEKSSFYTFSSLIKLAIMLCLIIYFVAFQKNGIMGVLYSYIISEVVILIILIPWIFTRMEFKIEKDVITKAINFGFPLIFTSVAMLTLNISDRYIIKLYANYKDLGLYDLGYRIAGIVNMFIIMPFSLAFMPFAYRIFGKENDKRFFSKFKTYFTLLLAWICLIVSLFSDEIIKLFALNPEYWGASKIIPIIAFSYIFFGMRLFSSLGMYLTNNTKSVAIITLISAVFNVILNFIFIPIGGMIMAAYSTLLSFILLYVLSFKLSKKYYYIPFEMGKLIIIILLGVSLYLFSFVVSTESFLNFIFKLLLVLLYPFILYILKFYEKDELKSIEGFYRKWRNPSSWLQNLKAYRDGEN